MRLACKGGVRPGTGSRHQGHRRGRRKPCTPALLATSPQVPLTAHAVLWCSFQVLSTRSQYEQASGVQILDPEPKQVGFPGPGVGGLQATVRFSLESLEQIPTHFATEKSGPCGQSVCL